MILNVYKPSNMTSRDVCNIIGKHFHTRRVGHTGTLDPLATGVLIVLLDDDTKLANLVTQTEKEYIATATLGIKTDTADITGNIIKKEEKKITQEEIENTFKKFIGTYYQEVPIYSAVKVNGKKLYEYARSGIKVVLPKREVTIKKLELLEYKDNYFKFSTTVSKGTYIRSLIEDIASTLNTVATMSSLERIRQGNFSKSTSNTIENILNDKYTTISRREILYNYKTYNIDDTIRKKVLNGNKVTLNSREDYLLLLDNNNPVALYQKDNDIYKVFKMLK